MAFEIVPATLTWQHNQYVTIGLQISADGSLNVYKASGSGTANNLVICYPQSDTYSAASEITAIEIPQAAGTYTMPITVWWDNQSGVHNDHNNHTISYEVIGSAPVEKSVNKVVLSDGTTLLDLTSDTADESHVLQGYTFHKADGTSATGTASGGSSITIEALSVTQNGTYTAPTGKAYTPVTVNVQSSVNIGTATVSCNANSTSLTFTGLNGTPRMFAVVDRTTKSNSFSGTCIMSVVYDGSNYYGNAFYNSSTSSNTKVSTSYSHTYSNGSLTVKSNSSSNAGQFYKNSSYLLVYVY